MPVTRVPATTAEKLLALVQTYSLSYPELARVSDGSVRAIEERVRKARQGDLANSPRPTRIDEGIDEAYAIASMMHDRFQVEPSLARAFISGRSPYLDEQAPADLLAHGHFELVRNAAIAFSRGMTPSEFRESVPEIPRLITAAAD